ncbi:hypothetical protein [Promineifilum sp.]|uniref:hypothetical protein n=1 Tax=Promineifilum sp. TaxID=2664178 RepID=UPI0035B06F60
MEDVTEQIEPIAAAIEALLRPVALLALIVLALFVAWAVVHRVRQGRAERRLAAVLQLADAAIDYVEHLDARGDLTVPAGGVKSGFKLALAGEWLQAEAARLGIRLAVEEAAAWVRARLQRRSGELKLFVTMAEAAREAVDRVERLVMGDSTARLDTSNRTLFYSRLAADWFVVRLAEHGAVVTRDEGTAWVQAELLRRLNARADEMATRNDLASLALEANAFLDTLRANNRLPAGIEAARDLAIAWVLTEVAKRGLAYTPREIVGAVKQIVR